MFRNLNLYTNFLLLAAVLNQTILIFFSNEMAKIGGVKIILEKNSALFVNIA